MIPPQLWGFLKIGFFSMTYTKAFQTLPKKTKSWRRNVWNDWHTCWWRSRGKHYQWCYMLQQSSVFICDMKINFKKKPSSYMNFPISLHSQTGQKTASVTLSMVVHLWMDFSVFQGVAPLSQSLSNHNSSQCMQLL